MLYVLNMAFFVLYLARAPMFFRHTTDVLRLRDKRLLCLFLPFILCECAALSSFATGALFSIQNGMYTRGAAYDLLFYCYLFYILASLVLILRRSRTMKPRDIAGCLGFNVALLIGTVIRKLVPQLMVMNTFSLVSLLIIYLSFQNPDRYMSERGQAFNIRGFALALEDVLQRNDYHILAFVIRNLITRTASTEALRQIAPLRWSINTFVRSFLMYDFSLESMRRLGFTMDDRHLILNDSALLGKSKEAARQAIAAGSAAYANGQRVDEKTLGTAVTVEMEPHSIVMMLGDNLADFTDDFSDEDLDAVSRAACPAACFPLCSSGGGGRSRRGGR